MAASKRHKEEDFKMTETYTNLNGDEWEIYFPSGGLPIGAGDALR